MSYCIAFNEIIFYFMFCASVFYSSRWFVACAICSRPKLSKKVSTWEDLSNLNRDVTFKVSVRAVQGISHGNKVFPQTFPNKLSLVAGK